MQKANKKVKIWLRKKRRQWEEEENGRGHFNRNK